MLNSSMNYVIVANCKEQLQEEEKFQHADVLQAL